MADSTRALASVHTHTSFHRGSTLSAKQRCAPCAPKYALATRPLEAQPAGRALKGPRARAKPPQQKAQSSNNAPRGARGRTRAAQMMPRTAPRARAMGGGGAHPPSQIMCGRRPAGWFPDPPQWKRNTVYAFLALGCGFLYVGSHSVQLEERPVPPKHAIPSSMWSRGVPPVDDKYKSDGHVE